MFCQFCSCIYYGYDLIKQLIQKVADTAVME